LFTPLSDVPDLAVAVVDPDESSSELQAAANVKAATTNAIAATRLLDLIASPIRPAFAPV
jgi:hypothetical protein